MDGGAGGGVSIGSCMDGGGAGGGVSIGSWMVLVVVLVLGHGCWWC